MHRSNPAKPSTERLAETRPAVVPAYQRPELHDLGSLEVVQLGYYGDNYDGSSRWWYYE